LDQRDIAAFLADLTSESFVLAKEVYTNGKNSNGQTIQAFSTTANEQMRSNVTGDYLPTFQKYIDYYGAYDYADRIISAAYDGTSIEIDGKTFDFDNYNLMGRAGTFAWQRSCIDQCVCIYCSCSRWNRTFAQSLLKKREPLITYCWRPYARLTLRRICAKAMPLAVLQFMQSIEPWRFGWVVWKEPMEVAAACYPMPWQTDDVESSRLAGKMGTR
jgi:hypothetical protein